MDFDGDTYWFELAADEPFLKTEPREVPVGITKARAELEAWLEQHPRRHVKAAPLFVNLSNRSYGNRMTGPSISEVVARCARRAGLTKIHAHMLRHTSVTLKIGADWPAEAIRMSHGWTTNEMLDHYAHAKSHYKAMVRKANGLPEAAGAIRDHMGSRACLLCKTVNPITAARCQNPKCNVAAHEAAAEKLRRNRATASLDVVAPFAIQAMQDVLIVAIARARGFTEDAA